MSDFHTGDSGAVPDSVPSGDSVTLIERLRGLAPWMYSPGLILEAADRLAVLAQRNQLDQRKIDAYDNARATVKIEGNTRAYYVLRAEEAERRAAVLEQEIEGMRTVSGLINEARQREFRQRDEYLIRAERAEALLELRESDRQSGESRGLETASAVVVEDGELLVYVRKTYGEEAEAQFAKVLGDDATPRFQAAVRRSLIHEATCTTAALPPPESGSSGLGSASALEVEAGELRSQAVANVDARHGYTIEFSNQPHCHALEYDEEEARLLASATKPEASPSPEIESGELGAAIRPRAEAGDVWLQFRERLERLDGPALVRFAGTINATLLDEASQVGRLLDWVGVAGDVTPLSERVLLLCVEFVVRTKQMDQDEAFTIARDVLTSTTTSSGRLQASTESSRPVSTDEEEGHGFEDGGLQSRPGGGAS